MTHQNYRILAATGMAAGLLVAGASGALAADGPNQPGYWETQFEGYANVSCDKLDEEGPYTVDGDYIAIIIKAGSGEDQNQVIMNPTLGTTYEKHENGKDISHVIFCTGDEVGEEPPGEEPAGEDPAGEDPAGETPGTPANPSVVQTDGWPAGAQDDSMLGMLGLAALLGGGAAVVVVGARTAARRD